MPRARAWGIRPRFHLPLDLHVLSLPLAFILSQDQTLHCISYYFFSLSRPQKNLRLCLCASCLPVFQSTSPKLRPLDTPSFPFGTAKILTFAPPPNFFSCFFHVFFHILSASHKKGPPGRAPYPHLKAARPDKQILARPPFPFPESPTGERKENDSNRWRARNFPHPLVARP